MNDDSVKELIESFISYRNLIAPLQESLHTVSKTYAEIREDLDALSKNFSGSAASQLEKVHSTLNAQAKSGQELSKRIDEYSQSGARYAKAVSDMAARFSGVVDRIDALAEIENTARSQIEKLDALIEDKRSTYDLKSLQKSLDGYNTNVEKISDFINRDIASVLKDNAEKIESIRRENEELGKLVSQQGKDIATLTAMFTETTGLLKKVVEGSTVNEQYLFDILDKWAADRKIKVKKD
ncbi:MAG: hypothetical protein J1G38_02005 [Clostridiales bacterium]|nr:hypothetical protein [Clostridiales bacterium]